MPLQSLFSFKSGQPLAIQQDQYKSILLNNGSLSENQIKEMENNLWVNTAAKMAPSNLVIRQYALIDLARNIPNNAIKILTQINHLTYNLDGPLLLWAEGYSYFEYTMDILRPWITKLGTKSNYTTTINQIINKIYDGFAITSYQRNNTTYPCLLGDLRDEPLRFITNPPLSTIKITIGNLQMEKLDNHTIYYITGKPIGLNTHIPCNNYTCSTHFGLPSNFKFYTGYNNKYKNWLDEQKDTFNLKRLRSIP